MVLHAFSFLGSSFLTFFIQCVSWDTNAFAYFSSLVKAYACPKHIQNLCLLNWNIHSWSSLGIRTQSISPSNISGTVVLSISHLKVNKKLWFTTSLATAIIFSASSMQFSFTYSLIPSISSIKNFLFSLLKNLFLPIIHLHLF